MHTQFSLYPNYLPLQFMRHQKGFPGGHSPLPPFQILHQQFIRLGLGVLLFLTLVVYSAMQKRAEAALLFREISEKPPEAAENR